MLMVNYFIFAVIASFLGVVGERTVKGESFILGRSKCESCHHVLPFWTLMPIIGYFLTKGCCHFCQIHVSLWYPFSEFFFALVMINGKSPFLFLFPLLFIMAYSDFSEGWIPDRFQLLLGIELGILQYFFPFFSLTNLISSLLLFLFLLGVNTYQEVIGGGDIKLLSLLMFGLGPLSFSMVMIYSSSLALLSLLFRQKKKLRFVPYLMLGYGLFCLI